MRYVILIDVLTNLAKYNEHWKDPSASCPVWIGMLYAMMRLAMLSYYHDGEEPPEFKGKSLDMSKSFRHLMCQCLILADYTKPYPYLIETLVLHMHADFSETKEANVRVWILCGIIARLAMRMGYHRDSKMFPNITPFQGEMRRRVWAYLGQADLLFSFQVGMPSMLRPGDTDTELPRNLFDEDFGPDSKEIPPARPNDQSTPVSYMIAKSRLSAAFGRVIEHTSLVKNAPYEVVIDIDAELRRARDLIPEHLRVLPFDECTIESTDSILMRYYVSDPSARFPCSNCCTNESRLRASTTRHKSSYTEDILVVPEKTPGSPIRVGHVLIRQWNCCDIRPFSTTRSYLAAVF